MSYNSQIGVPLSLLQLETTHELAILEAGISLPDEMENHAMSIRPQFGIFSNIGDAHDIGFTSKKEKLLEKLKLFDSCKQIIYCKDHTLVDSEIQQRHPGKILSWGKNSGADIIITRMEVSGRKTELALDYTKHTFTFIIPFINSYLVENAMHIVAFLLSQKWTQQSIQDCLKYLKSLPNRLEIKEGKNDNLLINDSYSLDKASLQLALEYQDQFSKNLKKVLFISGFEQQSNDQNTKKILEEIIAQKEISEVIAIDVNIEFDSHSGIKICHFNNTLECLQQYDFDKLTESCILIKGARSYAFERIFNHLSLQRHQTVLETNFNSISKNLAAYRNLIKSTTRIMAVVKAEAYGSGSVKMAQFLEDQNVDYLAVALIDEAIKIRESNINLPIMVFNIQTDNLKALWDYKLEPEIYSLSILKRIITYAENLRQPLKVHIKIDSGMHRLGFMHYEIDELVTALSQSEYIQVASVFSHLSASEDSKHDDFTLKQVGTFNKLYEKLSNAINSHPIKHILNTAGVLRFNDHQYDMVRLGLGLYGIDETNSKHIQLEKAHTLKAKVLQIKDIDKDQTTGYARAGKVRRNSKIAIISIGYADGLLRKAGNGKYHVRIGGENYPTIGNICMDVCMVDVTDSQNIKEGDDAIIFDALNPIENLADSVGTISYEIISRIAPRVKRIYVYH